MAGTKEWALILGASSGFGEAVSLALARAGVSIFGVHLDRKNTLPNVDRITGEIKKLGREAIFFNANAADELKMDEVVAEIEKKFQAEPGSHLRVVLHSLAFGTLKPFITDNPQLLRKAGYTAAPVSAQRTYFTITVIIHHFKIIAVF